MNEQEQTQFEERLRRARPAPAPEAFMSRLLAAKPSTGALRSAEAESLDYSDGHDTEWAAEALTSAGGRRGFGSRFAEMFGWPGAVPRFLRVLGWLAPVTAIVVIGAVIWRGHWPGTPSAPITSAGNATPALMLDDVQFGQELVSSFDTVARLPSGEPVRFRCRKWVDEMVVRDHQKGVVIQRRSPRVEVVPVSFETY